MKEMVKKCVVFVYLRNLDLSIPCAPLEPVKKLTNKQTNKQTRKAEKRNNNKKQKNKTKQTNQKKQRRNRRKAFIDFFLIDISIYFIPANLRV